MVAITILLPTPDINVEDNTAHPMAAIGTFNAHIGTADADAGAIARLQGAFGAHAGDGVTL